MFVRFSAISVFIIAVLISLFVISVGADGPVQDKVVYFPIVTNRGGNTEPTPEPTIMYAYRSRSYNKSLTRTDDCVYSGVNLAWELRGFESHTVWYFDGSTWTAVRTFNGDTTQAFLSSFYIPNEDGQLIIGDADFTPPAGTLGTGTFSTLDGSFMLVIDDETVDYKAACCPFGSKASGDNIHRMSPVPRKQSNINDIFCYSILTQSRLESFDSPDFEILTYAWASWYDQEPYIYVSENQCSITADYSDFRNIEEVLGIELSDATVDAFPFPQYAPMYQIHIPKDDIRSSDLNRFCPVIAPFPLDEFVPAMIELHPNVWETYE